jgi:phosphatidylglycerophosphate synthase
MEKKKPLYKSAYMEEYLDICFFHPIGFRIAKIANRLNMTPDQVTYISMVLGIVGGLMLASYKTAYFGLSLLVVSSIFDSADGQLARMSQRGSIRGRILDGLVGYFMFTSAYIGLVLLYVSVYGRENIKFIIFVTIIGGAMSAFQSSLYDYYRSSFADIVTRKKIPDFNKEVKLNWFLNFSYKNYQVYQKLFASAHINLMKQLEKSYPDGKLSEKVSDVYLENNKTIIRGWNLLGDTTRFLIILGVLLLRQPHWYFYIIIVALNCWALLMSALQYFVNRKFYLQVQEN